MKYKEPSRVCPTAVGEIIKSYKKQIVIIK